MRAGDWLALIAILVISAVIVGGHNIASCGEWIGCA